jgi:hypothetical protein
MREKIVLAPLVVVIFWIGIYPKPFFTILEPSVKTIMEQVEKSRSAYEAGGQVIMESKTDEERSIAIDTEDE